MTKKSATIDSHVGHLLSLRMDKHYRQIHGQCLIMGTQMIDELALHVAPIQRFQGGKEHVYQRITGLPNPELDLAIFPLPPPVPSLRDAPSLLVLDQLSDPGNMGTLLRTALGLGWGGVFFITPGVDPFNDKVLRASKGALFRLPYREGSLEEMGIERGDSSWAPYLADLQGDPLPRCRPSQRPLLFLSHESRGVRPEVKEWVVEHEGCCVTIPTQGIDSLNVAVAGGILMYTLAHPIPETKQ